MKTTKEGIIETIRRNKPLLEKNKVKSIFLFGSYVRNEQKADSDIDFLVEFKEPSYNNFINLIYSLEAIFKKEVEVVTPDSLSPYIRPNILKEAERIEG